MLELYEQNKSNGATASLANDPSPSEMHRGHAPVEAPSANGSHHQQSPLARPEVQEAKVDNALNQRDEDYSGGRVQPSSPLYTPNAARAYSDPPSDRPSASRHNGIPETSGIQTMNGRLKQETLSRKEVRHTVEKVEHYHEYREEIKPGAARVDDGGSNARERRRDTEDWNGREKASERATTVVKLDTVDVKTKATEVKEEERDTKEFVGLHEVDKDKIKAALEKRRKSKVGSEVKPLGVKQEPTNEEEFLERELENGVDAAAEAEKSVKERKDRKSRGEQDLPSAKKVRVKEEVELKSSRIEHNVTGLKERVADGDLASSTRKKIVKEKESFSHERKQVRSEISDCSV